MKRGGPLKRHTPLNPGRGLLRGTPLSRAARLKTSARAPRPRSRPSVTRDEVDARRTVAQRSGGVCEICGQQRATNWHHRQNKGQSGAWRAANGLHLCGSGTTGCHGHVTANPAKARAYGWSVRSTQGPADVAVWLYGRGWSVLTDDGAIAPAELDDEENTA